MQAQCPLSLPTLPPRPGLLPLPLVVLEAYEPNRRILIIQMDSSPRQRHIRDPPQDTTTSLVRRPMRIDVCVAATLSVLARQHQQQRPQHTQRRRGQVVEEEGMKCPWNGSRLLLEKSGGRDMTIIMRTTMMRMMTITTIILVAVMTISETGTRGGNIGTAGEGTEKIGYDRLVSMREAPEGRI